MPASAFPAAFRACFLQDVYDQRPGHCKRLNGERRLPHNPYTMTMPAAQPSLSAQPIRQLKHCKQCGTLVDRDVDAAKAILFAFISIWLTGERPFNLDWAGPAPLDLPSRSFHPRTGEV
jgi:hypothetical protein